MTAPPPGRFTALTGRAASRLAWLSAATLALMTLLTFVDVLGRELLSAPIAAKVEATELIMGLTVFLGIGLTTFMRGHTRVDIVISHLPPRWRGALDGVTYAVSIVFVALICWRLADYALAQRGKGDLTQIWEIPLWPVTVAMVLCSVVMLAALAIQWVEAIRVAAGAAARPTPVRGPAPAPAEPGSARAPWTRSSSTWSASPRCSCSSRWACRSASRWARSARPARSC